MSAFKPPVNTTWCPECARERVSCRHLDADALRADGSGRSDTVEEALGETPAIDRARAVHGKWLEFVDAASKRDAARVGRLADELRDDLTFIERTIDDLASDEGGA